MSTSFLIRALGWTVVLAPTIVLLVARKRLGVLNAASWLVIWGVVIAVGEHAMWAMRLAAHERAWLNPHSSVHYFMAGVYAAIGGVLLCVIARTLLREGQRAGWYAVLFAFMVGGALEVVTNGPTGLLFQHGFGPESTPGGEALFGYLFAWLAALVMAYKPVFPRPGRMGSVAPVAHGDGTESKSPGHREGTARRKTAWPGRTGREIGGRSRR